MKLEHVLENLELPLGRRELGKIAWTSIKLTLLSGTAGILLPELTACTSSKLGWIEQDLLEKMNKEEKEALSKIPEPPGLRINWKGKERYELEDLVEQKYGYPVKYDGLLYEITPGNLNYAAGESAVGAAEREERPFIINFEYRFNQEGTAILYQAGIITPERDTWTISDTTGDGKIDGFCDWPTAWNVCTGYKESE